MKWSRLTPCGLSALLVCGVAGLSRTIIVDSHGGGDYAYIREAAGVAVAGDSILVRDGDYYDEAFLVDSAVVLFAEHHGAARITGHLGSHVIIELRGSAELAGFSITGLFWAVEGQTLILITGGPATVNNCEFLPHGRFSRQMAIAANWHPPVVRQCSFCLDPTSPVVEMWDSTAIWMPYNYYGTLDTTAIHLYILDGHDVPGLGCVTVSPVADTFEWLATDMRLPMAQEPRVEIYPNPASSVLYLSISPRQLSGTFSLYNILGQNVFSVPYSTLNMAQAIHLPDALPSGTYFGAFAPVGAAGILTTKAYPVTIVK